MFSSQAGPSSSQARGSSQSQNQRWQMWRVGRFDRNKSDETKKADHETKRGDEIDKSTDLVEHLKTISINPYSLIQNSRTAYGCFKKGTLPNFDDDDDNYNGGRYFFVLKKCTPATVNNQWVYMLTCLMDGDKFDENIVGAKVHWDGKNEDFKFELWTKEKIPKDRENRHLKKTKLEELSKLLNLDSKVTLYYEWHSDRKSFVQRLAD